MGSINPETLQIWETSSGSEENLHPYGYAGGGFTVLSDTFTESQVIFYISLGQQGHLGGGGGNYPFAPSWDSSVVRGREQSRIDLLITLYTFSIGLRYYQIQAKNTILIINKIS